MAHDQGKGGRKRSHSQMMAPLCVELPSDFYLNQRSNPIEPTGRALRMVDIALGNVESTHHFAVEDLIPECNSRPNPLEQFQPKGDFPLLSADYLYINARE